MEESIITYLLRGSGKIQEFCGRKVTSKGEKMNNLKIFNSEEFGNIRTVTINEEAVEYVQCWRTCTNTQIAIKEHNSQMRFA